jgi:hypothetical protein
VVASPQYCSALHCILESTPSMCVCVCVMLQDSSKLLFESSDATTALYSLPSHRPLWGRSLPEGMCTIWMVSVYVLVYVLVYVCVYVCMYV